jgi:hypothetical protein
MYLQVWAVDVQKPISVSQLQPILSGYLKCVANILFGLFMIGVCLSLWKKLTRLFAEEVSCRYANDRYAVDPLVSCNGIVKEGMQELIMSYAAGDADAEGWLQSFVTFRLVCWQWQEHSLRKHNLQCPPPDLILCTWIAMPI